VAAAIIVAAGVSAYANSFSGVFLYDDFDSITLNPHIRQLWPLSEATSRPLRDAAETVSTRPLLSLTFALNHRLGGLDPTGFHAVNLLIHLTNGLLAFAILRRTLLLPALGRFEPQATAFALAVALLWTVHPLNTSSVTYVVQRAESLGGLLLLVTLFCAVRSWTAPHSRAWAAASVVACAAGISAKETVAAAPLIVLAYDATFIAGTMRGALRARPLWYLGLAATWLIAVGLLSSDTATLVDRSQSLRYLASQPGILLHYLRLAVWPSPLVMSYHWPLASTAGQVLLPLAVVGAMLVGTAWALAKRHWLGVMGAAFFLVLAPSSSIFALTQPIMEHRMYVPLVAVLIVLVAVADRGLSRLAPRLDGRAALYLRATAVVAVASLLTVLTLRRNADYRSEIGFWLGNAAEQPADSIALLQLGRAYLKDDDPARAHEALARAAALDPGFSDIRNELGRALLGLERPAEAQAEFEEAVRLSPGFALAHNNLGIALERQGNLEEAAVRFERALELSPDLDLARRNLARSRAALGTALARQGRVEEGRAQLERAVATDPDNADARINLGVVLANSGDSARALEHFERAAALAPDRPLVHLNLGLALEQRGDLEGAARAFEAEIRVDPGSKPARDALLRVNQALGATRGTAP
jgi:tetratricopeptide (TPR) repeat protein